MISKLYTKMYNYFSEYFSINNLSVDREEMRRIILNELGGCINGDDVMYYITPDKKYKFKIYRTENNRVPINGFIYYIITIEVFDGIIENPIMKISFDQNTCVDILYNMAVSMDILTNVQDSNAIYVNPDTASLNGYMIQITNIYGINNRIAMDSNSPINNVYNPEYNKDVRLEIFYRSYIYDMLTCMVSIDMTWEELSDFAFHVFFGSIIDLDFPEMYYDKLEEIEMFVANYGIYAFKTREKM